MSSIQLLTVAVSAMLLLGGATAVVASAQTAGVDLPDEANETAENSTETADMATENASELADDANESVGPPGGLPDVVPDFVSEIHATIDEFLGGSIDNLGQALQDTVPIA